MVNPLENDTGTMYKKSIWQFSELSNETMYGLLQSGLLLTKNQTRLLSRARRNEGCFSFKKCTYTNHNAQDWGFHCEVGRCIYNKGRVQGGESSALYIVELKAIYDRER